MTPFQERTTFGRAVEFVTFQAANTRTFLHKVTRMTLCPTRLLRRAVLAYAFCHHSDDSRDIHVCTSPRKPWNTGRTRTLPQLLILSTKASTLGPVSGQAGGIPIFRTHAKPLNVPGNRRVRENPGGKSSLSNFWDSAENEEFKPTRR